MKNFSQCVYETVRRIPPGRVASYGMVAAASGFPAAARAVGTALHHNPSPGAIPCHRVVNRAGRPAECFAFGGAAAQLALLAAEGVVPEADGCVDMRKYCARMEELTGESGGK